MRWKNRWNPAALAGLVSAVLIGAACRDVRDTQPDRLLGPGVGLRDEVSSVDDSTWNQYSADLSLQIDGGGDPASPPLPTRTISYHTEKTLEPGGTWRTVFTLTSGSPLGLNKPYDLRQAVFSEAAGSMQFYDRQGKQLPTPTAAGLPAALSQKLSKNFFVASPGRIRAAADPRAWIDNIILSAATRNRHQKGIEKVFGAARAHAPGRDTYRLERGAQAIELVVDPNSGVILEQTVTSAGQVLVHLTNTFTEASPGVYVRTGARIDRMGNAKTRPSTLTETLSNVRVTHLGGQN